MLFLLLCLSSCAWQGTVPIDPDEITYPPLRFEPPQTQRTELANGIVLYLLEDHELPFVNLSAVVRMGSYYDPTGKEGLADLTGTVMRTGGTRSMTGDELDDALDLIAAEVSIAVGTESCTVSLSVLRENLDKGLELLSDILMNPVFEEEKVVLAKSLETEDLRRIRDNPQRSAFRKFRRLIYEGDSRGRVPTISSIEKIQREDMVAFHRRFFHPTNTMIAVSGDIEKDALLEKIPSCLGGWVGTLHADGTAPAPAPARASLDYFYKDTPQSVILLGYPAPGKENPDYYTFEVLDFIIGSGGFRSRIFGEVRNRLGLAYSAGSFYSPRTRFGIFGTYAMVKGASTLDALGAVVRILNEIKAEGVHPEELAWAKESLINGFVFSFATSDRIVTGQMMLEYEGLSDKFLTRYKNNIEKVTLTDITDVASRYLSDDNRIVLVLGDRKRFARPLSSFGDFRVTEVEKQ